MKKAKIVKDNLTLKIQVLPGDILVIHKLSVSPGIFRYNEYAFMIIWKMFVIWF